MGRASRPTVIRSRAPGKPSRRFRNYHLRALLYAGRPNWDLLDTLTPP